MTMNRTVWSAAVVLGFATLVGCSAARSPMEEGLHYYRSGQYLFAVDSFSQEIKIYPRSAAAYNNRAIAKVRLGELNGAILDYNRAIELAPYDPELYYNRGNALVAAGDIGLAIQDFSQAIALNPTYARAYFNRGTARSMAGQRDLALEDWRYAIDVEGDPWTKSSMRRSAGLEVPVAVTAVPVVPKGQPTVAGTVAPPPPAGTVTDSVPLPRQNQSSVVVSVPAQQQPAALVSAPPPTGPALDARALANRAISRELDGDHAGALQDLNAALVLEPDPARRDSIANLLRLLDRP
jgi:tetratricopeptide (TPR) repeat protein